ncbi:hypothetical protein ONZ45_g591 [Pleurotus djamor]|nr:hypothetical protein ONZ45_g591 [Pleurotus djamor]
MYSLLPITTLALVTLASVDAAVVPRSNKPDTYLEGYLEPYETYHTRYLAIECHLKHNTEYFDDCCHPMLSTETLEKNRKAYCTPSPAASSSAHAAEPTSTEVPPVDPVEDCDDEEEDDEDYEDCEEDDEDASAPSSPTPVPTSSAVAVPTQAQPSPEPKPVTTSESKPEPTPEPKPEPTSEAKPTSTPEPKPATTKAPEPTPTPEAPKPVTTKAAEPTSTGGGIIKAVTNFITGGYATFYFQHGNAGACGNYNSDDALIAAMDFRRYGDTSRRSPLCGKQVNIVNTQNQKSVVVTVADACPTCDNENSIDLSRGAFAKIADYDQGKVDIKWTFV